MFPIRVDVSPYGVHCRGMNTATSPRITTEQARTEFPTSADRDAEYARLDRLAATFPGTGFLADEIDYRRGVIESTDPRSPMSGNVPAAWL